MFTVYKEKDYASLSRRAAAILSAEIIHNPKAVLGLATGTTPIETYQNLVESYREGLLDFSKISSVNLDEYCNLSPDHPQSYRYFMNYHLFDRVNINKKNTFVPDGMTEGKEAAARYDALIESLGGIDLQVLGIGQNGHIGFNEPGEFIADTHMVTLSESTIKANARLFASPDEVPKSAVTMGLRGILSAKKILLLASGKNKKQALEGALYGPITADLPASVLQLHPKVIVITDCDIALQKR